MDQLWLLPLIIFITGLWIGIESSSPCPPNQFRHDDRICCEFCGIGTYMYKPYEASGSAPLCMPCEDGTSYMDEQNNESMCKQCSLCDPESEVEERECDFENNRECVCRE
uniref:TNFR-Cys domain-containing protein n=1 Tax=Eptatretus burgeri TaxID=7764 RepID=A0A8C4R0U7_EPTBU